VWNIGAEGQFVVGALAAGWVAMQAGPELAWMGRGIVIPILLAGVLGGMLWAGIVALLRDRFNANEILVSLMLVYVAELVLGYLVYGPWKDPKGYNFPQTITFDAITKIPKLVPNLRANIGVIVALVGVAAFWVFLFRTYRGFQLQVGGLAPAAARYAGFSSRAALWTALMLSGGMAGLAGGLEAAGPLGQLTPYVPAGYGFAAIIVAYVGRLHPVGIIFSAVLMSMFYIGGELAQSRMGLPKSLTGRLPGPAAVHAAGLRHADPLPRAGEEGGGCSSSRQAVASHERRLPRRHDMKPPCLLRSLPPEGAPAWPGKAGTFGTAGNGTEMDSPNRFALLIAATLNAGTVLAIAGLGLLINEKAGIVNLGAEGMMLVAAIAGFATAVHSGNDWLASPPVPAAGALLAAAFGVLVIWLNTNQYASGLALSLFGTGFSAFVGIRYTQEKLGERPQFSIPGLADIPFIGPALFKQHPMVYIALALTFALAWFLYKSRPGLMLRAIGESPESAHALGYPVRRIRMAAVMVGGALCGVAGAYISVVYTPLWVEGMVAGKGWIALALTTFATWRPARVLLGAYLFGGVTMLQFHLQGQGVQMPSQFLSMLPYVATIVVLVLISRNANLDPRQHAGVDRQAFLPGVLRLQVR
jgi:ABC-type uncharacterized transport system permease subunit